MAPQEVKFAGAEVSSGLLSLRKRTGFTDLRVLGRRPAMETLTTLEGFVDLEQIRLPIKVNQSYTSKGI